MPYADREKQLSYQKAWNKKYYSNNKKIEKKRILERKESLAKWLAEYKSRLSCQICGESTTVCLDFHHIDKEKKDFSLAFVKSWGWGLDRIKKEISKCVVLCANCHRKAHAGLV